MHIEANIEIYDLEFAHGQAFIIALLGVICETEATEESHWGDCMHNENSLRTSY